MINVYFYYPRVEDLFGCNVMEPFICIGGGVCVPMVVAPCALKMIRFQLFHSRWESVLCHVCDGRRGEEFRRTCGCQALGLGKCSRSLW